MVHRNRLTRLITVFSLLLLLFSFPALNACGKKKAAPKPGPPAPPAETLVFAPGAIQITYAARQNLNFHENKPHTLTLVILQLEQANTFNKFAAYREGIEKLLDIRNPDASVVATQRIFIEPGTSQTITLDRVEKATWVGIVAGYYDLVPNRATKVFQIPQGTKRTGMLRRKEPVLEEFVISLDLGPNSIQEVSKP